MKKRPRKGQIWYAPGSHVLVTGPGNKKEGNDYFAGVVVHKDERTDWPVGMYSDTWNTCAFERTPLKIQQIVSNHLQNNPS